MDKNQPSEASKPSPDLLGSFRNRLNSLKDNFNAETIGKALQAVEKATAEQVRQALDVLSQAEKQFTKGDPKMSEALKRVLDIVSAGGVVPTPGSEKFNDFAKGIEGIASKVSQTMEMVNQKLGLFGSDVLEKLAKIFGPNTILGQLFAAAKDSPLAQKTDFLKKIPAEKIDGDPVEIVDLLRDQISEVRNAAINKEREPKSVEKNLKLPEYTSYPFREHLAFLMNKEPVKAKLKNKSADAPKISQADFEEAGKTVANEEIARIESRSTTAVAQTAEAPKAARTETELAGPKDLLIKKGATDNVNVTIKDGKATFKEGTNTYSVSKIGTQGIDKMKTADGTDANQFADVVFVLKDKTEVHASAQAIVDAMRRTSDKKVKGKTLTGGDYEFELISSYV